MIRWKQTKDLVIVDLLQSNRQANQDGKSNKVAKSNLWWRVLLQNVLFLFIYGIFIGTLLFRIPLPMFPGLFTQSIGFMVLFVFMQVFQLIFNLFYDDNNNLSEYLSLPFSMSELFLSKMLTILLNTLALFLLPFVLMVMLGTQAGTNIIYVVLAALFNTVLLMIGMVFIPFILIHLLHKIPLYVKHKKVLTIFIYIAMFVVIFLVFYTVDSDPDGMEMVLDPPANPLFIGFFEMFVPGLFLAGWMKLSGWIVLAVVLLAYTFWKVIPELYSEGQRSPAKRKKSKAKQGKKATQPYRSKWHVFARYQLRQLQDTTFILQMLFSKLYFPFIFIAPALIDGGGFSLAMLSDFSHFWGLYMLIGVVLAIVLITEISLPGVIISFDKENFHYIKSIPMSFRQYMQFKFWFAYAVEWLLGVIIIGITAIFIKLPILVFLNVVIGYSVGTYLTTVYYYMRDYRLLNLNWSNFTELMQRGMNQFISMIFKFILFLAAMFGLMALSFWLFTQTTPMVTLGISIFILVLLAGITYGAYMYSKKKFWVKFNG